jgi:hypothetical protein
MAKILGYNVEVMIVDDITDDIEDTPVLIAKQAREPIKRHKGRLDVNDGEYDNMKAKQKQARKRYQYINKLKRSS